MAESATRTIRTEALARVEGEGEMFVRVEGSEVREVELRIFEPPRLFESFLRGRAVLRGARYHRPDLRHLPGRLPDERVRGDGGRPRRRGRLAGAGPAPAAVLRRVAGEPHPPRLPPSRPRLPGLRERLGDGARPSRGRRARAARQEARQRAHPRRRRARDPSHQRARRRLLQGAGRRRPAGAARPDRAGSRRGPGDRSPDRDASVSRHRARPGVGGAALRRRRVSDRPRAHRLLRGHRHRARRVRRDVRGVARRALQRPARARSRARLLRHRPHGALQPQPGLAVGDRPRRRAGGRPRRWLSQPLHEHRGALGGDPLRVRRGAAADRGTTSRPTRPPPSPRGARAWATGPRRLPAGCSTTATS